MVERNLQDRLARRRARRLRMISAMDRRLWSSGEMRGSPARWPGSEEGSRESSPRPNAPPLSDASRLVRHWLPGTGELLRPQYLHCVGSK